MNSVSSNTIHEINNRPKLRLEVCDDTLMNDFYGHNPPNYRTDSGFDLFMPVETVIPPRSTTLLDLRVRAEFLRLESGYYLYPRSSIFRTSLRLANSVGIIDAGYRGTLKVAVDNIRDEPYMIRRGDRLFQICQPSLKPFDVEFGQVNRDTERGEGGHGSTSRPLP